MRRYDSMDSDLPPRRVMKAWWLSVATMLAAGCATLPQAGPEGVRVVRDGARGAFVLREVTSAQALPPPPPIPEFQPLPPSWNTQFNRLAPGDVISVIYYEVGTRLFAANAGAGAAGFDPSAKSTTIGAIPIEPDGTIRLPYTGSQRAAGLTVAELAAQLEARLHRKSDDPQVIVHLDAANGSGVMVGGEIARPGRVTLSGAHEKLLDIITLAGGARGAVDSILVHVERQGAISEGPLEKLKYDNLGGLPMEPGDRVQLIHLPLSYAVMGSANRVSHYDLPLRYVSLVEALSNAGGPNEYVADPQAVFVFRYEKGATPTAPETPTVYHFNLLQPSAYLLTQRFYLADKDVIYVGGARSNQPSKLLQIIGQLFTPFAVARQAAN